MNSIWHCVFMTENVFCCSKCDLGQHVIWHHTFRNRDNISSLGRLHGKTLKLNTSMCVTCNVWISKAMPKCKNNRHIPWIRRYTGRSYLFSVQFQREHVLRTCSRYTPFLVVWTGSKENCSRYRTVPAGTWSNHVLGTNCPLSTHPKQVWTLVYREQCSKWAGLSTQTTISTESAHQNDLTPCAVYTQYVILRRPRCVPFSTWTNGYREHFTVLLIWMLVYREHVPRTCSENILPGLCTENIYERAHTLLL